MERKKTSDRKYRIMNNILNNGKKYVKEGRKEKER